MNRPFKGIIPNRFTIGGVEISTRKTANVMNLNNFGYTAPFSAEIFIQTESQGHPISHSQQCQTFWHEVVHYILDAMHEKQDNPEDNERFATCFSNFLNEILQSCECDEDIDAEASEME